MPRTRPAAHASRLRRVLLLLIVLLVAALAGLYWFGRAGRPRPLTEREGGQVAIPEGEITLVGEGFEFTHTEGARPVFRIRGESVRADRAGTVYLDDVALTLYDEEGVGYEVSSRQASFNRDSRAARLAGDVVLRGPEGSRLETRGVRLEREGELIESAGPVRFVYGDFQGRANRMRLHRDDDVYTLSGDVVVESREGLEPASRLTTKRLVFERGRHQVRAMGDAVVVRGEDRIAAQQVNVFLDETDSQPIFLRARFEVTGRLADASGRPVTFRGRSLSLLRDPAGAPKVSEMEGDPTSPLEVVAAGPRGSRQKLAAGFAVARFEGGDPASITAFHAPRLLETSGTGQGSFVREVTARRLEAGFRGGEVATVTGEGDFRYRDAEVDARGERAHYDVAADKGEMSGAPVVLTSDRGELQAPRVVYDRNAGLVNARDGVRATMREAADVGLAGSPLGEGEGPVRVEAAEAWWRDAPRSTLFRGDVRAWRDESLLLAESVRADRSGRGDRLEAEGGVRTVWVPEPERPASGPPTPVEVTSRTLVYDKAAGELVYEGDVHAEQQERSLACPRLVVELTAGGEAEEMTCTGSFELVDAAAENAARGTTAVYDLAARKVTMRGDPVIFTKSDGTQIRGAFVVYDVATGAARVARDPSRPAAAARQPPASAPAEPPASTPEPDGAGEGGG